MNGMESDVSSRCCRVTVVIGNDDSCSPFVRRRRIGWYVIEELNTIGAVELLGPRRTVIVLGFRINMKRFP